MRVRVSARTTQIGRPTITGRSKRLKTGGSARIDGPDIFKWSHYGGQKLNNFINWTVKRGENGWPLRRKLGSSKNSFLTFISNAINGGRSWKRNPGGQNWGIKTARSHGMKVDGLFGSRGRHIILITYHIFQWIRIFFHSSLFLVLLHINLFLFLNSKYSLSKFFKTVFFSIYGFCFFKMTFSFFVFMLFVSR